MAEVFTKYIFDTTEASASLSRFKQEVRELQGAEQSSQKTFQTNAQKRAQLLKEEQQDLIELRRRRDAAYAPEQIALYNKRIAETERRVKNLKGEYGNLEKGNRSLIGSFQKIGGAIGLAFGAHEIIRFTKEAIKLAAEAEGVRTAFERVGGSTAIMRELQEATRGTVTELELMRLSVEAAHFKIPLEQMATLFEFATNRAIETGESVDKLVGDITSGIGKKSMEVLSNLGLGFQDMQEAVKDSGDFTTGVIRVINQELGTMGAVADTAATKMQRVNAQLEDSQTKLGELLLPAWSAFLGALAEGLGDWEAIFSGNLLSHELEAANEQMKFLLSSVDQFVARAKDGTLRGAQLKGLALSAEEAKDEVQALDAVYVSFIADMKRAIATRDLERGEIEGYTRAIQELERRLKALRNENTDTATSFTTIADIQQKITDLTVRMNTKVAAGSAEFFKLRGEIEALTKEMESYVAVQETLLEQLDKINGQKPGDGMEEWAAFMDSLGQFTDPTEGLEELTAFIDGMDSEADKIMALRAAIAGLGEDSPALKAALEGQLEALLTSTDQQKEELLDSFVRTEEEIAMQSLDIAMQLAENLLKIGAITQEQYEAIIDGVKEKMDEIGSATEGTFASTLGGLAQLSGAFKDVFNTMAKDAEKNAQFLNALTLFTILLNQAQALSQAIASAKGVTAVDYIVQIGIAVAAVVGAIAKAKAIQNQAKAPTAPRFGYGGEVEGRPHTQGGVHIEAERGEYIVKSSAYAKAKEAVHAINSERFDTYVTKHYIEPLLKSKQLAREDHDRGFARNIAESLHLDGKAEHYLKQIARKGNGARIENWDELARLIKKDGRGSTY